MEAARASRGNHWKSNPPMTYAAIIADPPWQYSGQGMVGNGGRGKAGADKIIQVGTDHHYPTMSLDEIKALPIPANDDCMMFMWVTNPFLASGAGPEVLKAWGFEPITVLTWAKVQADKQTPSMKVGYWFRSASEHVIVGKRGRTIRPAGFPALPTWFPHGRLAHSVKPDLIHEIAEKAMPNGPYLEMFARRARTGWDLWGNQAPPERMVDLD